MMEAFFGKNDTSFATSEKAAFVAEIANTFRVTG
jgi:hypothetical protein